MNDSGIPFVAERCLIASVILNAATFHQVRGSVRPSSFSELRHEHIWAAFERLDEAGRPIDMLTVAEELERVGALEKIGGRGYISDVTESDYTSMNAPEHARIVVENAERRRWLVVGAKLREMAADPAVPVTAAAAFVQNELEELGKNRGTKAKPIREIVSGIFNDILSSKSAEKVLRTGFRRLDEITGGLLPGQFIIGASRPSVGKTTLALGFGLQVALQLKKRVVFFSLEMTAEEIGKSAIAAVSGVPVRRLAPGKLGDLDRQRLLDAAQALSSDALLIRDEGYMSVGAIRAEAFALHAREPLALVIVDYLQMIPEESDARFENNQVRIARLSRSLKQLAKDLKVPVILLCQLNREIEKREGGVPVLSDLRDSGSLEQDGDLILALYRSPEEDEKPIAKTGLVVLKNRTGPRGAFIPLLFHQAGSRFEEDNSFTSEEQ